MIKNYYKTLQYFNLVQDVNNNSEYEDTGHEFLGYIEQLTGEERLIYDERYAYVFRLYCDLDVGFNDGSKIVDDEGNVYKVKIITNYYQDATNAHKEAILVKVE